MRDDRDDNGHYPTPLWYSVDDDAGETEIAPELHDRETALAVAREYEGARAYAHGILPGATGLVRWAVSP